MYLLANVYGQGKELRERETWKMVVSSGLDSVDFWAELIT